jgi:hypothetical protein
VLKSDMSIDYDSPDHQFFWYYAVAMICVYPVGIPLMYLWLLARVQGGIKKVLPKWLQRILPSRLAAFLGGVGGDGKLLLDRGQGKLVNKKLIKLVKEIVEVKEDEEIAWWKVWKKEWWTLTEKTANKEEVGDESEAEGANVAHVFDYITDLGEIEKAAKNGRILLEDEWITTFENDHKPLLEFIARQSHVGRVFWHEDEDKNTVLAVEVTLSEDGAREEALRRRAHDEKNHPSLSRMKFLYAAYEPQCWWFEVFETSRRLLLTGGQVLLSPGTPSQIVLNLIICVLSMRIYAAHKPFVSEKADKLAEVVQFQLFFTMLAALCIKVNLDDLDDYNVDLFDSAITCLQFMGPVLLFYQAYIEGGTDDAMMDTETGGAMDEVRRLARSYSNAEEGLEMTSWGKKIGTRLRAISGGARELGSGVAAKHFKGRFKTDSEDSGSGETEMRNKSGTEQVANPLAPHVERAMAFSGARSQSGGLAKGGKGPRSRGESNANPDETFKNRTDEFSDL